MKNILFTASFLLFTTIGIAQLTTNLILNPRPPATLSKWSITQGTVTLIVNNQLSTQGGRKRAKIKAILKASDGTEVSTSNMNMAQIVQLPDGQTLLSAAIVYPLEIQQFTGKYQNSLNRTGKLPADNYQLCITLVDEITYAAIAPEKCANFYVAAVQLPIGMMPANDQTLDASKAQTAITFRWTPLVPRPQGAVNYRLQVFEVLDNQQPVQALRSNRPIFDKIIVGQTQYIWQPQGILGFVNEDLDDSSAQRKGWDGSIKGKNVAEKGIQENGLKKNELETAKVGGDDIKATGDNSTQKKGWDGSIKGKNVAEKGIRENGLKKNELETAKVDSLEIKATRDNSTQRKGWDGSIKGKNVAEKGIQENGLKKNELETAKVEGDDIKATGDNSTQKKGWDGSIKGKNVAEKGINENGLKKNELAVSKVDGDDIKATSENKTEKKGWDGSIKGNIAARKGWDGSIKGGKMFIWSIQALDAFQNPIGTDGNYEGRSEPIIFKIR